MVHELYPWGGKMEVGNSNSCVAVVTLSDRIELPLEKIALNGSMKTENLGVEKVVANLVSNPNVRFLIVCGNEVRGHRAGDALISLHKNGTDENNRVIGAKSAIPYIENLPKDAVARFQKQIQVVDLVDVTEVSKILRSIDECLSRNPGVFGDPYFVKPVAREQRKEAVHTDFALHSRLDLDEYGIIASPVCEV